MTARPLRNTLISAFVVGWIALFQYESLRLNYLAPWLRASLPKVKFLYPPAGWIMFFHIDRGYGMAEVYGVPASDEPTLIDPHRIFETRFVGYDNIRRNVLVGALSPPVAPRFCAYLRRKFPEYRDFAVVYASYQDVTQGDKPARQLAYQCR